LGVEDFENVAVFTAVGMGNDINERGDVSPFEVVFGEVSIERDAAIEWDGGIVHG
jgi:hypothetical protein